MIPTPSLSHLTKDDYRRVYEPAEDTFILLDALEEDVERLQALKPRLCVEIGSGSGCVSAFISQIIGATNAGELASRSSMVRLLTERRAAYLCTDINPEANRCTELTGKENKVTLQPIRTSLLSGLRHRLNKSIDVLLFNPPYVPTVEEEEMMAQNGQDIEGSWAGGATGTKMVDEMIQGDLIQDVLSPGGSFYLVAIRQNDPAGLNKRLESRGLKAEIVLARRAGGEHLHIIRAIKE